MKTFNSHLLVGILCFSLSMAVLIFWRESWDGYRISFARTFIWQFAIWSIWYLFFRVMVSVFSRLDRSKYFQNKLLVGFTSVALIALHYIYYFLISDNFSSLIGLPKVHYGVYPYFFVFYSMIDVLIVWGLWSRIGTFKVLEQKPSPDVEDVITVRQGYNNIVLKPEDIQWVSAEDYYARLYTASSSYLIREPLKVLLDRLPEGEFTQIHRSTIVRKTFIKSYTAREVTLKDGSIRRISRSGMKRLQQSE